MPWLTTNQGIANLDHVIRFEVQGSAPSFYLVAVMVDSSTVALLPNRGGSYYGTQADALAAIDAFAGGDDVVGVA